MRRGGARGRVFLIIPRYAYSIYTYKDNKGWTVIDSERDIIFGDAFDWLSEFVEHDTWTLVEDEFVFKKEEDAARFIFTFCI